MTIPVVIATNGLGIAVTDTSLGAPANVAANGLGIPVVVVTAGGLPLNFVDLAGVGDGGGGDMDPIFVARPRTGPISAHQGLHALSDGRFITFDDNAIQMRDSDFNLLFQNTDTDADMGQDDTPGFKLADTFAIEDGGTTTVYIQRYDEIHAWTVTVDDFVYDATKNVAVDTVGIGYASHTLGPVAGHMYTIQYVEGSGATVIHEIDIATGVTVQNITLSSPIPLAQGIHYQWGKFYVTGNTDQIYEVEANGTNNGVIMTIVDASVIEGISGDQADYLYVLFDGSLDEVMEIKRFTTDVAQTTGQSTGDLISNGDFETGDFTDWVVADGSAGSVIFGGGAGGKPDSNIARGAVFRVQSFYIPQEAWDSVDAGTATLDLGGETFGSGSGLITAVAYDASRDQIAQANDTYTSGNFTAWIDRSNTGFALPVGSRSVLVALASGSGNWYADTVSLNINW